MAMTKEEEAAFNRGYLIACCNIANLHNYPCIACDVLAELHMTEAEVAAADLTEYDATALAEIRAARGPGGDPIVTK